MLVDHASVRRCVLVSTDIMRPIKHIASAVEKTNMAVVSKRLEGTLKKEKNGTFG